MPLYQNTTVSPNTQLLVWKVTEPFEQLRAEVTLNERNEQRLSGMKSEMHRRAFLSVRKLLAVAGYTDFDLYYDEFGKPHLNDGRHISISHSHELASIILSDRLVGIDLELCRDKIMRIADKFAETEFDYLDRNAGDYVAKLTVIWGVKEAVFKIRNEPGISFKDHIDVYAFEMADKKTVAHLHFESVACDFEIIFETIEDSVLVYAFEKP